MHHPTDRIAHTTAFVAPVVEHWLERELHDWCNKGRGMCYLVCGVVHIKETLLLIGKSRHVVAAAGFLSRYLNVLSASLNKTFPFFICHRMQTEKK